MGLSGREDLSRSTRQKSSPFIHPSIQPASQPSQPSQPASQPARQAGSHPASQPSIHPSIHRAALLLRRVYPRRRWRRSVEWYIYHRLSIGGIQGLEDPRVISVGRRPALAGHYPRPRVQGRRVTAYPSSVLDFRGAKRNDDTSTYVRSRWQCREIRRSQESHPSRPPADRGLDFSGYV